MFQMRQACAKLLRSDEPSKRLQRQDSVLENKLLRAELEKWRQERSVLEEFWIRNMIAEAKRCDALAEAKQKALDQALAGPTGRELAALQHEIMVLKKRLEESDLKLATVKTELAQAQAERGGREFRL